MVAVRYILSPKLVGAQRLIHRDKHLTLVIGPPVNSCATSKVATQTHLTQAETAYVYDAVQDLNPEMSEALQNQDFAYTSCPCTVPEEMKACHLVERLPCPIHEREEYVEVTGWWVRKKRVVVATAATAAILVPAVTASASSIMDMLN